MFSPAGIIIYKGPSWSGMGQRDVLMYSFCAYSQDDDLYRSRLPDNDQRRVPTSIRKGCWLCQFGTFLPSLSKCILMIECWSTRFDFFFGGISIHT
jgi:hypothetical protein